MEINKASKEDIKHISRVYVDSWRATYRGLVPDDYLKELSYEEAEISWIDFLNYENEPFIYVATNDEGKLIGFASGKSTDDKNYDGELYSLYLTEECRGLGVGRHLVSAITKHFIEKDIHTMMVWVMKKINLD
ncbi:N-acetyltransferase family protein [Sporosarcina sp. FA15]|uniref:GNAT family N-acetyltransferase n=1 Tax=Sporosarcina sp. FA15 TaxID=3413031 RepID=UPI003F65B38E